MEAEARGILASTKDLARSNPAGFALLVALATALLFLTLRSKREPSRV